MKYMLYLNPAKTCLRIVCENNHKLLWTMAQGWELIWEAEARAKGDSWVVPPILIRTKHEYQETLGIKPRISKAAKASPVLLIAKGTSKVRRVRARFTKDAK